jgi:uncharacterized protein involved in exopolysaccharide biosynthesis
MTFQQIIHTILVNIKSILFVTIISSIIVFIYLLLISPITYNSEVSILPPSEDNQMGGLSSLLSGGDFSSLLLGGGFTGSSQLFVEILQSRSAAEYVVSKNDLVDFYSADDLYEACEELQDNLDINVSKEGIISLAVDVKSGFLPRIIGDTDSLKRLSATLSNSYAEALDKLNREKNSYKAKRARIYIEEQLERTRTTMDSVESALMEFQQKNKTISLPDQLNAAIEGASKLKSEMVKTELEIGLLEPNLKEDNVTLVTLKKKLAELKKEYGKLELGSEDYLVAFKDVPELGMELARLMRDVKIQNEVYLLLQQQYYKEKIQENRDTPTIEVLDKAILPDKVSSPRLLRASLASAFFIFILLSAYYVLREKKVIDLQQSLKDK